MSITSPPWTLQSNDHVNRLGLEIWAGGMLLARIGGLAEFDYANGRLMAKSPELLKSLREMIDLLRGFSIESPDERAMIGEANDLIESIDEPDTIRHNPDDFLWKVGDKAYIIDGSHRGGPVYLRQECRWEWAWLVRYGNDILKIPVRWLSRSPESN